MWTGHPGLLALSVSSHVSVLTPCLRMQMSLPRPSLSFLERAFTGRLDPSMPIVKPLKDERKEGNRREFDEELQIVDLFPGSDFELLAKLELMTQRRRWNSILLRKQREKNRTKNREAAAAFRSRYLQPSWPPSIPHFLSI